jgi:prophage antirepressor-like protein
MNQNTSALAVFQGKKIRRVLYNDQWYFAVLDIIQALTDSINPSDYLKKLRKRDDVLNEGWGQIVTPLRIDTEGGPQSLNCVNTERAFRLIQSIPSKKAEPFKQWLAHVGYERIQELPLKLISIGIFSGISQSLPILKIDSRTVPQFFQAGCYRAK